MAGKPINMKQLKSVLRHHCSGHGIKSIVRHHGLSRNTVRKYIRLFVELRLTAEEVENLSESQLSDLFTSAIKEQASPRLIELEKFFPYVQKELKRPGVTRSLLWREYFDQYPNGYRLTQFCEYYRRWTKRVDPTMRIEYKAADKVLVDYAGKKLKVTDRATGEIKDVEVFVSILGASQLIYLEASPSQKKADFIASVENAILYYGGVPKAIVTDNLKSAVKKSNRYEPELNEDFSDFADHYQTAVIPTRAYKPKDKALVEGAVKIVYRSIYAQLRNQEFMGVDELNQGLWKLLGELNDRKLTGRPFSRRELFEETEQQELAPLPAERFEIRSYAQATVLQNGHVCLGCDKHYYSVPYEYIRRKVKVVYTSRQVVVYYKYKPIATHKRVKSPYNYTTDENHLASKHRQYTKWNATYFLSWAESIDNHVHLLITRILDKKQHPEQAYKSCMGVLSLRKKVGDDRFISACKLALDYERYSYKAVQSILEKGIDKLTDKPQEVPLPRHKNIRGKDYYKPNNTSTK